VFEPVGGAAELAAFGHVVGCELGISYAEVLKEVAVAEIKDACECDLERVDVAAGMRPDGAG
jgi:hypothetical protein